VSPATFALTVGRGNYECWGRPEVSHNFASIRVGAFLFSLPQKNLSTQTDKLQIIKKLIKIDIRFRLTK